MQGCLCQMQGTTLQERIRNQTTADQVVPFVPMVTKEVIIWLMMVL